MFLLQSLSDLTLSSLFIFLSSFAFLSLSIWLGKRMLPANAEGDEDYSIILGATLSLLGLLIGFTLSMSISGFNSRQASEQNEAITIRSAYLRADLLPEADRQQIKTELKQYLQIRIRLYETQDMALRLQLREQAVQQQGTLWERVRQHALANPTPVSASILSSINDLVSTQQKTIADWQHQIPFAAWFLLMVIAICCNLLVGYNARKSHGRLRLMMLLPAMISLAFLMIAEIDAPGRGVIRVAPANLLSLQETLQQAP